MKEEKVKENKDWNERTKKKKAEEYKGMRSSSSAEAADGN